MKSIKFDEQVNGRMPAGTKRYLNVACALTDFKHQELIAAGLAMLFGEDGPATREIHDKVSKAMQSVRSSDTKLGCELALKEIVGSKKKVSPVSGKRGSLQIESSQVSACVNISNSPITPICSQATQPTDGSSLENLNIVPLGHDPFRSSLPLAA